MAKSKYRGSASAYEIPQVAYRGYLIKARADSGFSITKGGHVIAHQCPSIDEAKKIVDILTC